MLAKKFYLNGITRKCAIYFMYYDNLVEGMDQNHSKLPVVEVFKLGF